MLLATALSVVDITWLGSFPAPDLDVTNITDFNVNGTVIDESAGDFYSLFRADDSGQYYEDKQEVGSGLVISDKITEEKSEEEWTVQDSEEFGNLAIPFNNFLLNFVDYFSRIS